MSYHHLNRKERGVLSQLYNQRISMREIARQLGRNVSSISRELKRNTHAPRYRAESAHAAALLRRKGRSPLYERQALQTYVRERLLQCWSPEQIAGRIRLDYPEDSTMRVSHSSIYRWLHQDRLQQAADLKMHLRHCGGRHGETRGKFNGVRQLRQRSKLALHRKRLGDWEVDTIVSAGHGQKPCLLSMCDRKSRYCILVLLKNRTAGEVMRGFHVFFDQGKLPLETMTGDRGTEFACFQEVEDTWNIPFYFTRPRSPWQKPSVENLNGLVRQFFPKGTNFLEIDPDQVSDVMLRLNQRPRKALCFHTPYEVLHFT